VHVVFIYRSDVSTKHISSGGSNLDNEKSYWRSFWMDLAFERGYLALLPLFSIN